MKIRELELHLADWIVDKVVPPARDMEYKKKLEWFANLNAQVKGAEDFVKYLKNKDAERVKKQKMKPYYKQDPDHDDQVICTLCSTEDFEIVLDVGGELREHEAMHERERDETSRI